MKRSQAFFKFFVFNNSNLNKKFEDKNIYKNYSRIKKNRET